MLLVFCCFLKDYCIEKVARRCVYVSLLRSDCRHALGVNVSEAVLLSVGFIFAIHWRRNRRRGACRADRFVGIDLI